MSTISQQIAEKVQYLQSIASSEGYDIPRILRKEAIYLRTKKAAHYHDRATALEDAAARLEAEKA